MSDYYSTAVLNSDYSVTITVSSQTTWSTTHWTVDDEDDTSCFINPTDHLLYSSTQSGYGTLSESDTLITIHIPVCPRGVFTLTIGSFSKEYDLYQKDGDQFTTAIVATGDILVQKNYGILPELIEGPNLVLFSSDEKLLKGSYRVGGLFIEDTQVGWAFGTTFTTVYLNTGGYYHPYSGVVFTKFIWFQDAPSEDPQTMKFIPLSIGNRGTSTILDFEFSVEIGYSEFPGPHNEVYDVQPTHVFVLDGKLL